MCKGVDGTVGFHEAKLVGDTVLMWGMLRFSVALLKTNDLITRAINFWGQCIPQKMIGRFATAQPHQGNVSHANYKNCNPNSKARQSHVLLNRHLKSLIASVPRLRAVCHS